MWRIYRHKDTTTHSHSLSISTVAERWNITPLTASFTLETPQHVYALSATPNPHPIPLSVFFALNTSSLSLSLSVNLSFTQPPCFSPSIPEDRVIIWAVCSPPAPTYPLFPSSPPVTTCRPPPNPPTLPLFLFLSLSLSDLLLNLSSCLGGGPLGPQQYSWADLCNLVSEEPHQATPAHTGQTHTTSWRRYRQTAPCHIVFVHRVHSAHM